MQGKEKKNKTECPYCGDAPISHSFSYLSSSLSIFLDPFFEKLDRIIPQFVVRTVEGFLRFLFHMLFSFRLIKLSLDPEKAITLRSKVIWEEARRRGIKMEQIVVLGKYTDNYRAKINNSWEYFDSLPIPLNADDKKKNWDDKFFLKRCFERESIPVPKSHVVPLFKFSLRALFDELKKPVIIKPQIGSRGRHTITNINDYDEFRKAIKIVREISPRAVVEEHIEGYVCRATLVDGKLSGFFRGEAPYVEGDGQKTIEELVKEKDKVRPGGVKEVKVSLELHDHISRMGFTMKSILPNGARLVLSHRTGRYFGGKTKEMIDALHPSFVPILEKAGMITGLPVAGFDCIIPDPEAEAGTQRWGIIECNTLPFIDLHYFALEGEPGNIAGQIWDLWNKKK